MNENKKDVNVKIGPDIEFFVTDKQKVIRIKEMDTKYEIDLRSNHEEANTRMILHLEHAANPYNKILVASQDTDVFVILLTFHTSIEGRTSKQGLLDWS